MKKSLNATMFIGIVLIAWMASYWMTRSKAIAGWQQENPVWMQNVPEQIVDSEEAFRRQIQTNIQTLKTHQAELGQLLDDPQSTDQMIRNQADLTEQTHAQLLREVAQHLKTMQKTLPDEQKELLNGFCQQTLQGPMCRKGTCMESNQNGRYGQGWGGMGFGRQRRQSRCGLNRKLQLTDEQLSIAAQQDPTFEDDVRRMQEQLLADRSALLSLLESKQDPNGHLTQLVEQLIVSHNALEKRLIDYVLTMRPYFTAEQQKRLMGLCRQSCQQDPSSPEL